MSAERFMQRALDLAGQARGLTSPNPMVGAVVVAGDTVVGEGYHRQAGDAHAEVEALAAAGVRARGATLYVTLEPCNHYGRTPPCAPAVIAAGIGRVVIAIADPNPLAAGGCAALRAAGIEVVEGVLAEAAAQQNRVFVTSTRRQRPHVTLKAAMTADGKIGDVHGESKWITGEAARAEAHRLRSEADAIVVGVTTVLRDDPALTVRLGIPWPREPYRVVLDSDARTPPQAQVLRSGSPTRVVVAVGADAPGERVRALEAAGATVTRCPAPDGRVEIATLLSALYARQVRAVLVEGGGEAHAAFLEADVVDRVTLFLAPLLLGGRTAPSAVGGRGRGLKDAVRLGPWAVRTLEHDLLLEADVRHEGA